MRGDAGFFQGARPQHERPPARRGRFQGEKEKAGEENRTPVLSLEGSCSAIELRPPRGPDIVPLQGRPVRPVAARGAGYHDHPMERLILRSAAVCTRRPWWVVAIWIVLLAAALPFSGKAQGVLSSGGFDVPGSQSQQAIDYLNNQPGRGAYSFSFLVDAPTAAAAQARVAQVRAQVAARYPEIHFTTQPQASPDGSTISFVGFASVDQNRSLTISRDLKTLVQSTDPARAHVPAGPVRQLRHLPGHHRAGAAARRAAVLAGDPDRAAGAVRRRGGDAGAGRAGGALGADHLRRSSTWWRRTRRCRSTRPRW